MLLVFTFTFAPARDDVQVDVEVPAVSADVPDALAAGCRQDALVSGLRSSQVAAAAGG